MRHSSPDELMDVAEGVRPPASLPHLATCDVCRAQIDELRGLMAEVGAVPVPEPSPLFWDHWSARVRDKVAAEAAPNAASGTRGIEWLMWRPLWSTITVAAAIAVVVWLAPQTRSVRTGPPVVAPASRAADVPRPIEQPESSAADEPLLVFIEELASGVDVDAVFAAGLTLDSGATDAAVSGLSSDEQRELQRLLQEALDSGV